MPHTAFRADVAGPGFALSDAAFAARRAEWESPRSYAQTQALARDARAAGMVLIRYRSVRDPQHRPCLAVLSPKAFRTRSPLEQHTWLIKVTRKEVLAEADFGARRIAFEPTQLGLPHAK